MVGIDVSPFPFGDMTSGVKVPRCRSGRKLPLLGRGFLVRRPLWKWAREHLEFDKWLFLLDDDNTIKVVGL